MQEEHAKTAIVPFGKYRGQPIESLLGDQAYLDWLTSQDWFRERYQNIYAVIINYPGKPAETPAHNQMQVKFLSRKYQLKLVVLLLGGDIFKWNQSHFDANIHLLLETAKLKYEERYGASRTWNSTLREALSRNDGMNLLTLSQPIFEDRGTDVSYDFGYGYRNFCASDDQEFYAPELFRTLRQWSSLVSLRVELKPSVGDDFPSVLRQMRTDRSNVLVIQNYTGTGATWNEFVDLFESQRLHVVREDQINAIPIPKFDTKLRVDVLKFGP